MNNRRNTWIKATLIIRNVTRVWNSLIFRPELPPIFVVFCCRYVTPVHIPRPQINYTCVRYEWDLCQCCLQKKVYVTCRKKSEVWISWSFWLEIIKILTNSNSRKILRDSMDDTRFLQWFTPRQRPNSEDIWNISVGPLNCQFQNFLNTSMMDPWRNILVSIISWRLVYFLVISWSG